MIRNEITPSQVVEVLNRSLKADPEAIRKLFDTRISCNDELSKDPEIQVAIFKDGVQTISFLGLLNGFFGIHNNWGVIQSMWDLKCSGDETHEVPQGCAYLSEACAECGSEIVLGDLVGFSLCPNAF